MFGVFAFGYFLSALLRAVTATLAPVFSDELGLQSADLGLLAGAYFFGFAALQLPLGKALDRFGPRRTLLALMAVAVVGCAAFASATGFAALVAARVLIGAGMAASLMAPLTAYRQHLSAPAQLRANSWMLMTGSLGMLASTLPVQWLLPAIGWRGLFWLLAGLLVLSAGLVAWRSPRDRPVERTNDRQRLRYRDIAAHPLFLRTAPLAFFVYGGMIAVQSLWAGPWLTRVSGWSAAQAAQGLFGINLSMLVAFGLWGLLMPRLVRRGVQVTRLLAWGLPLPFLVLAAIVALGDAAGAAHWATWCVACTFVSISQPAVAAAFPAEQAGRALSAFNLVIFAGVFSVQWGLGLLIDLLLAMGWSDATAFRCAFAAFGLCGLAAYAWFLWRGRQAVDNAH
ncbi:MAG: MFS transporter [Leptothrix sp. (in: Bacteria)]|nr:MFS transporter [Leptothrix sp. (in: b-proteobacteria)]